MILGNSLLSNDKVIDQLIQSIDNKLDLNKTTDQELKSSLILPYSLQVKGKDQTNTLYSLITLGEDSKIKVGDISTNLLLSSASIPSISYVKDGNQITTQLATLDNVLPLTAGSTKPLTDDLYITSGKSLRLGNHAFIKGDDTDGRLTISAGKDRIITIRPNPDNSTGQMHIYGTVFRPGSKDGVQLGTDSAPWSAIYGTALYQDGKQVANKEDLSNYLLTTGGDLSGSLSIKADSLGVNALTLEGTYYNTSISFKSTNYGNVAALIVSANSLRPSWQHNKFNEEDGGWSGSLALLSDVPTITQNGETITSLDVSSFVDTDTANDTFATKAELAQLGSIIFWDITEEEQV